MIFGAVKHALRELYIVVGLLSSASAIGHPAEMTQPDVALGKSIYLSKCAASEEDMHAVLTYLRNLKPVKQRIPDIGPDDKFEDPSAVESFYGGNYSLK